MGSSSTGAGMLKSRAGVCFWAFSALCSWMVLKCHLTCGASRPWQQLSPALPFLQRGRQRRVLLLLLFLLLLLRCLIPVLFSLRLCSTPRRDEGRRVFDLCSSFWKKISAPVLSCPAEHNSSSNSSIHGFDPTIPQHSELCPCRSDNS